MLVGKLGHVGRLQESGAPLLLLAVRGLLRVRQTLLELMLLVQLLRVLLGLLWAGHSRIRVVLLVCCHGGTSC